MGKWAGRALAALVLIGGTAAASPPAGGETASLDPFERYERVEWRPERAAAVDPAGKVAWFDPGVGSAPTWPGSTWTRAGVWDLEADAAWELGLPPLPGAVAPLPVDVDAAGNVVGLVAVEGGALRALRWEPDGTPTVLDLPDDPLPEGAEVRPVHVHGDVAVGWAGQPWSGGASDALRWDGAAVSVLPPLPGTTSCRALAGEGPEVLGTCWTPSLQGTTLVRWDLEAGTVGSAALLPHDQLEAQDVFDVSADGLRITRSRSGVVEVSAFATNEVRSLAATWSTLYDGGLFDRSMRRGVLLPGDVATAEVLMTVGSSYDVCPCQAAVVRVDGSVRWLDPDPQRGETTVEGVGVLHDGVVVAATGSAQVDLGTGIHLQHRGTALYEPVSREGFSDVPPGHPFFAEVARGHELGYVRGYGDGTFRPGAAITRQAVVAMLVRARALRWGLAAPVPCDEPPFTDVDVGHPFCAEIALAAAEGIVQGYPDGSFRPGAPVTRQAIVAMARRAVPVAPGAPAPVCGPRFFDVGADHPFCPDITWAADHGVVVGYPDGRFAPGAGASRQATVAILERALAEGDVPVAAGWYPAP